MKNSRKKRRPRLPTSGSACITVSNSARTDFAIFSSFSTLRQTQTSLHKLKLLLLHPLNGLFFRTTWVSRYQKGKTSLDLNEARDDGVLGCSGISWTICKQSAPHSRQITTPTPRHSIFYRLDALPGAQPTLSKHWKHKYHKYKLEIVRYLTFFVPVTVM